MNGEIRGELRQYGKLVSFLGETLGNTFEAVLYDLTDPEYPVLAEVNAAYDVQDQLRDFVARAANSPRLRSQGYFVNYPVSLDYARMLKTSVFFIFNEEKLPIGALCLGMRCDMFWKLSGFVSDMLKFTTVDLEEPEMTEPTAAPPEPSLKTIEEVIRGFGVEPGRVSLNERVEIITDLYDLGVYNLKGAVARTAEVLQISEQSVYRYLARIKRARD